MCLPVNYTLTDRETNEPGATGSANHRSLSTRITSLCSEEGAALVGRLGVGVATFRSSQWPRAMSGSVLPRPRLSLPAAAFQGCR